MHHHQAESGMKEEEGREMDAVARRRGLTEMIRLVVIYYIYSFLLYVIDV